MTKCARSPTPGPPTLLLLASSLYYSHDVLRSKSEIQDKLHASRSFLGRPCQQQPFSTSRASIVDEDLWFMQTITGPANLSALTNEALGESSTYTQITKDGVFNISYVDGTGSAGLYFTDVVHVGEFTIDTGLMYLGLATVLQDGDYANDGTGVVGIGYVLRQAQEGYFLEQGAESLTLIQGMVNSSAIARQAYSLYLNDYYNGKGVIIFGGVDFDKYTGNLVALQVQPTIYYGIPVYLDLSVALTGISIEDDNGIRPLTDETFQWRAVLDSGPH